MRAVSGTPVRRALARDLSQVLEIADECGLSRWTPDDYFAEICREDSIFYVATQSNGDIVGFVLGRIVPGTVSTRNDVEIYNVGVRPLVQKNGVGRELLETFLNDAKAKNTACAHLEVRSGNQAAITFYLKNRFSVVSTRKKYYSNPTEDATLMTSVL